MCLYGVYKLVNIINPNQNKKVVAIDACIADEIETLNKLGIITLGCCCSHGLAGQITEWDNGFGKWKGHIEPPHALIELESVELSKKLGYRPFPYYYANGDHNDVWKIILKTGCLTYEDCINWHKANDLILEKNIGIIA